MSGEGAAHESRRQLQAAMDLNHLIASAAAGGSDERALMNGALSVIGRLVKAMGCSFVPVDEWQQPLPPFTFGRLPAAVMSAWSIRLASGQLRERCAACTARHSAPGACPLHPAEVGDEMQIFCLPLSQAGQTVDSSVRDPRTGRTLGVLHLYLPEGQSLSVGSRGFIERVLPDIAQAYQAARLRSQEAATMRHLNMLNRPAGDLMETLTGVLEGLRGALEADFVLLSLAPDDERAPGERKAGLLERRGGSKFLPDGDWQPLLDAALSAAQYGGTAASPEGALPAWIAANLPETQAAQAAPRRLRGTRPAQADETTAGGGVLVKHTRGILLAGFDRPLTFHPRQTAILQAVAAQSALLLAFEQRYHALEYSVVIQERARLAREIHDGLAQTLALLKLQAAQMQSQLAQGEFERLAQVLKDSYQVLSEAYLDTRQAIDNLRLAPQDDLEAWIEHAAGEFERGSGLVVERALQPLESKVALEVQVQLVRIVQEALSNVRKHSRARRVCVGLYEQGGALVLEVRDDGQGFDAADLPDDSRHGLRGMRERAEMIGADFQVTSQDGQGTAVRLSLPVWVDEEPSA